MPLTKPPNIENDAVKSAKWDEITAGKDFKQADMPTLALLCQWYKIAQQAQDELDRFENTAYTNDIGDFKSFPQIATLKTCSAEIRQLNKQLGIQDGHDTQSYTSNKNTKLKVVQDRRIKKAHKAI